MKNKLYGNAIEAHRNGKHERAIMLFNKILEGENIENESIVYYNLAKVYADLGEYKIAISNYHKSINGDDKVASVWYNLGNAYLEINDYEIGRAHV